MAGEKVLLVDDEVEFVEALSERLQARGLQVEVAGDGPEAIKKVGEAPFDVVILDMAMPGMNGIDTLRAIKKDHPHLQVVLLTGHGTTQKGVEAMKLGAMDFLEKPADINLLLEKVREAKAISDDLVEQETEAIISDILKTKGW